MSSQPPRKPGPRNNLAGRGITVRPIHLMVVLAASVILIAGMKAAASLLVPFLVAAFLALIAWSPIRFLDESRMPNWLGFPLVVASVLGIIVGLGYYIGSSVNRFVADIPSYRKQFVERFGETIDTFNDFSVRFGFELSNQTINELINPEQFFAYIGGAVGTLGNILTNSFLVVIVFAFVLGEFRILPGKVRVAVNNPNADLSRFSHVVESVQDYIGVKTIVSAMTGVVVGIGCWILGVPYAILWGIVAFFLNYIPSIGSIIAAIPPALLAFVVLGTGTLVGVIILYFVTNTLMGNVIEPRWQGQTLGLSTFVVFMSLIFWGWVFGPAGMVLSVPLTMILKLALETHPDTRWLAVMLGGAQDVDGPKASATSM